MRGLGKGSSPTRYHPSAGPTASPVVETGSRGPISEATRATSVPLSMAFVRPSTSGQRASGSVVANARATSQATAGPSPRGGLAPQVDGAGGDRQFQRGHAACNREEILCFADAQRGHAGVVFYALGDLAAVVERDGVGEHPRFCGQGCGRIAKGPESLVPLAGCEARRQPGKLRPEVLLDTLVGEVDDLGHRDAQQIEGHGERDDVEVPNG